ncbi:Endonuclease-reverse transcriptase [Operophtera brumata]|uniref:Endonuclease-reverse transcriptase n=1 Tax=Operophtera brumata TaxID=104452 RepID=A0A0L7LLD6_OPEBR|nr:Endonuclease-reverse transcriptase [Operophtera brumata]
MNEVMQAISAIAKQIKETDSKLSSKIDSIDEKLCNFKLELDDLKLRHEKQEERLDYLEKEIRIRNLVFFGISDEEKSYFDLEEIILKIINENLQLECNSSEVQHVRRIGKKGDKPRPIMLGLSTYGKKVLILKNKNKLIGTGVYIKEDYPPKVLQERKNLQEQLKIETDGGKKAFIKNNKLIVVEEANGTPKNSNTDNRNKKRTRPNEKSPNTNTEEKFRTMKTHKTIMANRNITQYLSFPNINQPRKKTLEKEDLTEL